MAQKNTKMWHSPTGTAGPRWGGWGGEGAIRLGIVHQSTSKPIRAGIVVGDQLRISFTLKVARCHLCPSRVARSYVIEYSKSTQAAFDAAPFAGVGGAPEF